MSADALLARLESVRITGAGRWVARCPAHEDRKPSLAIRELDDGRVLLHDFAGCSAGEVVAAVGLEMDVLFPPREAGVGAAKPERRAFLAVDALACVANEATLVAIAAARLARGEALDDATRERLGRAAARLHAACDAAGVRRG